MSSSYFTKLDVTLNCFLYLKTKTPPKNIIQCAAQYNYHIKCRQHFQRFRQNSLFFVHICDFTLLGFLSIVDNFDFRNLNNFYKQNFDKLGRFIENNISKWHSFLNFVFFFPPHFEIIASFGVIVPAVKIVGFSASQTLQLNACQLFMF